MAPLILYYFPPRFERTLLFLYFNFLFFNFQNPNLHSHLQWTITYGLERHQMFGSWRWGEFSIKTLNLSSFIIHHQPRSFSQLQIRLIDLYKKEQLKEDFIKINPRHTVPTLDDDGFILTESRAIAIYLAEKCFPDGHSLYPKDVQQRARIHELLQFDSATLYPRIRVIQVKIYCTMV